MYCLEDQNCLNNFISRSFKEHFLFMLWFTKENPLYIYILYIVFYFRLWRSNSAVELNQLPMVRDEKSFFMVFIFSSSDHFAQFEHFCREGS